MLVTPGSQRAKPPLIFSISLQLLQTLSEAQTTITLTPQFYNYGDAY